MSTLQDINTLLAPDTGGALKGLKAGDSKGNDIFQSILASLNGQDSDSSWVSTLYSDYSSKSTSKPVPGAMSDSGLVLSGKNKGDRLNRSSRHEDLIVPASLQNQLVAFLEKQGFSLKDINQVLSSTRNSNGSIQIDKLLAGLSGISSESDAAGSSQTLMLVASFKESFSSFLVRKGFDPESFGVFFSGTRNSNIVLAGKINDILTGADKEKSFIGSSQVPGVQNILFRLGLGAEDVKKIIEKSKNGKSEIELGKLSAELNKALSSPLSESDLDSLLSRNNISVEKNLFNNFKSRLDAGTHAAANNRYLSGVAQKDIKENIEALLKDRNISEEDIKSILEKLDFALAKKSLEQGNASEGFVQKNRQLVSMIQGEKQVTSTLLGESVKQEIAAFLRRRGSSDRDIKSFLDSFSLSSKKANIGQEENYLKSSMLNEKTFGLFKNDQSQLTADQGNLKLNLTEMIKLAGKKSDAAQRLNAEGNLQSMASPKNGSAGRERSEFQLKETQQISGLNISQEREIKNIGKANQANTASNIPQPLPKIIDRIMFMIRTGEFKSRLQITPPDLGKLDIDLTFKNGHLHANLSTESAAVKEIIEANLNQLKQQLSNQGLTVDKFDVMVGLDNGKHDGSNTWAKERNNKNPGHNISSRSVKSDEILVSHPLKKDLIKDNQIDVHV